MMRKSRDVTDGSGFGGSEWHVIFESISDGILLLDNDNTILDVNGPMLTALGLAKDQVVGRKCYELLHGSGEVLEICPHQKMLETGQAETAEIYIKALDATCLVTASPVPDKQGCRVQCVHTIKNINDRVQAQRAMQESEERFRLLYQQSPLGYQSLDVNGCFVEVNPAWLELMGYRREEVIGHSFAEFIVPEQHVLFAQRFPKFKQIGHTEGVSFTMLRKDGRQIEVEIDGKFLRSPSGEMKRSHCVLHNVTKRRNAEKKLKQIEWLLTKKVESTDADSIQQPYGDLSMLNTSGLLVRTVGRETLRTIAMDYLELLETSAAIYERNGDYAIGLFTSGWCRFLDAASRQLCETDDHHIAMDCGRWHCYESCWKDASLASIESGEPVDVACLGGLRLYAIPIFAGGEVVGSMNFGYGDPPRDPAVLKAIADRYQVNVKELSRLAKDYETRPPYIIELAKRRLQTAARLIGEMVERKLANISLLESERQLRQAQEMAHLGHWQWDIQTGQVEWCREVYRIFQLDPNEFTPHIDSIMALSPWPEESHRHQELIQRAIENRESGTYEQRFLRPDGSVGYYFSTYRGLYDETGDLVAMEGTVQDITERKQIEEALRSSQRTLSTLMSNLPGFCYRCLNDSDWTMSFVSDGITAITGYTPDAVKADGIISYNNLIDSRDREWIWNCVQKAIEAHEAFEYEYRIITRDGALKWMWERGSGVYSENGDLLFLEGFVTDITDRKQIEAEREKLLKTLERKNEELESIVYVSSHDLKSPLVNIQGFSEELGNQCRQLGEFLRQIAMPEEPGKAIQEIIDDGIPKSLEFIRGSGVKMKSLIDGLLVVSQASRQEIEPVMIDMNDLALKVQESFAYKGKEQSVEFVLEDLPSCYGDWLQVDQVFMNLVGNAMKHLDPDRPGRIHVSGRVDKDDSIYCVADNGIGISDQHQEKIFELFYRLDTHREGEGIGLTVVKRIVENHSGQVWFESTPGQGSRFYVRLPHTKN